MPRKNGDKNEDSVDKDGIEHGSGNEGAREGGKERKKKYIYRGGKK